ncbi:hypothetical protein BC332_23213 [Capsicum chinense]|nr:hypothetical protein BC332_23213 [Capsicum chinense]
MGNRKSKTFDRGMDQGMVCSENEISSIVEKEPLPIEEKGNEVEHLLLNQTDKNQETLSITGKRPKTKTKKSQSSKKSKSILSIQDQEVGRKDLAASNDKLEDVNPLATANGDG